MEEEGIVKFMTFTCHGGVKLDVTKNDEGEGGDQKVFKIA